MATIETAWRDLTATLEGEVVLPDSPRYEEVRRPQIPRFHDVRPQAVVLCRTPEDVAEAIAFARRSGIEVAVRSGGHDFAGRSSGPGMVLDLTPMHSLEIWDGLAIVGPGFRLGDLYAALAEYDVTIPGGCGATVGIGGQALGGGLGLLGRSRGLTSDQLVAAEVVLADGRVVECDEQRHEDLFWALRGAGAQGLGVVTRLTLRTVAEPAATSFHLKWPSDRASALIAAWQEWSPTGPDELAASLLVTVGGEAGADPVVHLFGSMIGSETETTVLLDEFVSVAGADAASSERAHMRYGSLKNYLAERGPGDQEDEHGRPYPRPASTPPRPRPRAPGCRTRGSSCTPPARAARTRTSPIPTYPTSTAPTGAPTSSACGASRKSTTRSECSAEAASVRVLRAPARPRRDDQRRRPSNLERTRRREQ
jgi:FAD/FMN-containing dehydrogenase